MGTFTIQHSGGTTHSEINASSNVTFYGLKFETRLNEATMRGLMDVTNSHNNSIIGGSVLFDADENSSNSIIMGEAANVYSLFFRYSEGDTSYCFLNCLEK